MQSVLSYIGMLMMPGGLLIFTHGIIEFMKTLAFVRFSHRTIGKIIEIKEEYEVNTRLYRPVVEFRLKNKIRFEGSLATRHKPNYKIGETIEVLYLPETPEIARIGSFGQLWGNGILALVAGVVFTLAALFLLGKL
ncbi:MAG TPA: DUF3592 domain-containing protein [Pyrinomonadaceae bacterium]|nr:DUF3592 domain-containing protein [Pyrinomonadaceae bacterium]